MTIKQTSAITGLLLKHGAIAAASVWLATTAPAQASGVFLAATDEVKFVNDGQPGFYVEYGIGKTYLLWNDEKVKNILAFGDNNDQSTAWSIWDEDWGPLTKSVVLAVRKWRELPPEKQILNIKPAERQRWRKDMFATANSPKRYPPAKASTPAVQEEYKDADGCSGDRRMVWVKQGDFLGMGGKKVPIGCMTQEEMNRWNVEQQNNHRPVYVPPAPTYQPPRPIRCTTQYGVTTCF